MQLIFEGVFDKKLEVEFTKDDMSSNSGLLLFRPIMSKLKISERITKIINDPGNPLLITHEQQDLIEQRLTLMVCGFQMTMSGSF